MYLDDDLLMLSGIQHIAFPGPTPGYHNSGPDFRSDSEFKILGINATRNIELVNFNKSIGILLASYTRAINKQQNWSGSLFRSETKATCLTAVNGISPNWITKMGITEFIIDNHDMEYPNVWFNYILFNPVKDRLVKRPEDWEFSSYSDFIGIRKGNLINRDRIHELGLNVTSGT